MKIEHWRSQTHYPNEQLNYRNLLAACLGGHGQTIYGQHCDTKKGDMKLQWNPAEPTHHVETRIRYELDGSISANEAKFDGELNQVLNLNLPMLKNNRKRLLDAVLDWWKREKLRARGPVPRQRFVRERDKHVVGNDELLPYCQVKVWWLDQKLARMVV